MSISAKCYQIGNQKRQHLSTRLSKYLSRNTRFDSEKKELISVHVSLFFYAAALHCRARFYTRKCIDVIMNVMFVLLPRYYTCILNMDKSVYSLCSSALT